VSMRVDDDVISLVECLEEQIRKLTDVLANHEVRSGTYSASKNRAAWQSAVNEVRLTMNPRQERLTG
jgi:hypothetical protein